MSTNQRGFTIVELLIVIVIIAILAAITIITYTGITNRANDSAIQSDLTASAKNVEVYKLDNGNYPASFSNLTAMKTAGISLKATQTAYNTSTNNYLFCYDTANDGYAIAARSKSGKVWYISDRERKPTEYPTWNASVVTMCTALVTTYLSGQWSYQSGAWNSSLIN